MTRPLCFTVLLAASSLAMLKLVAGKEIWFGTSPFCSGEPRDCPIFDMTYVRSDNNGDGKRCLTGTKVLCRTKELPHELTDTPANELTVASYNVFERPFFITHDGQTERTCHIPRALLTQFPDIDVIIFEEAFLGGCWYGDKLASLRGILALYGFPHHTDTVGSSFFIINGGVFIASKWPIGSTTRMQFSDSGHADKFSKKGAVYVKIEKKGMVYHIVGTHMQAQIGSSYDVIRVKQANELAKFVWNLDLPSEEPVLIGGDFNCDLNNNLGNTRDVIQAMQGSLPQIVGDVRATYDYVTNDVVEPDATLREWLDYVMPSVRYRQPTNSSLQAHMLTADQGITYCNSAPLQPFYVWPWSTICSKVKTTRHLSDHYPVIGRFKFE